MENKRKIARKSRKLKKAVALVNLVRGNSEPQTELKTINVKMEEPGTAQKIENGETGTETSRPHTNQIIAKYVNKNPVVDKSEIDALKQAKQILAEKRKRLMQMPHIYLTPDDMVPFQKTSEDGVKYQLPLYPTDVQQLLLFALHGSFCKSQPRWCKLKRPGRVSSVVVIMLDGLGYSEFTKDKEAFPFISQSFESSHLEMVSPEQYGSTVAEEIYSVQMNITQIKKSNVKVAAHDREQVAAKMKPRNKPGSDKTGDKFSRSCLLLSSQQMQQEGYPMPVETENNMYNGYVFTKDQYTAVTADSPMFGLDCEMCVTSARKNELTRVSIVDENGKTVYDTLVKPYNTIINYVTQYSGITREMLEGVDVRIEDVQKKIQDILPSDAILCGQSLNFDLIALKLFHPYVIDTSVIFNTSGIRRCKAGLKKLSGFFLNRMIQNSPHGHSSVEDAKASLDLVKLKLKKGLEFGDATISGTYFPDIETYFLGDEQEGNTNVQNVETTPKKSLKRALPDPEELPSNPKGPKMHVSDTSREKALPKHFDNRQRKTMFNQNNSVHVPRSFFELVDEAGRPGCIVGREWFMSNYASEPIEKLVVASDKQACQSARLAMEKKEFLWVNLEKYREVVLDPGTTEEDIKETKRKLDGRVKKLVHAAKENSLVVLMMSGRWDVNAGTFVKVKVSSL